MDLPFSKDDDTVGTSGVPIQDTFWILDSSKIQQLADCPRGFFFSHILGWQETDPNIHLVFGSAWHKCMEVIMRNGTSKESVRKAYEAFMEVYKKEFASNEFHSEHYAKNPSNVIQGLSDYAATFSVNPRNTLWVEVAGTAPIGKERNIAFKVDTIRKHPSDHQEAGKYYVLEHKTTSRKSKSWMNKWNYKLQVGTYIHVLNTWLEDPNDLDGLTINGSIFRKNDTEHVRIPVRKNGPQMMQWLGEAHHWWDFYEEQMRLLGQAKPSDTYMEAFPRNTESCSKFGCKFPGICNSRPNPLRDISCPVGYERDFWNPKEREEEAKNVMDFESNEVKSNDDDKEGEESDEEPDNQRASDDGGKQSSEGNSGGIIDSV